MSDLVPNLSLYQTETDASVGDGRAFKHGSGWSWHFSKTGHGSEPLHTGNITNIQNRISHNDH